MARKLSYDRELSGQVRDKALADILEVLKESAIAKKFGKNKSLMLLKLAGTVLPRLQEHTGRDGEQLFPKPIYGGASIQFSGHNSNKENIQPE